MFSGVFRAGSVDIDNDHVVIPFDATADLPTTSNRPDVCKDVRARAEF